MHCHFQNWTPEISNLLIFIFWQAVAVAPAPSDYNSGVTALTSFLFCFSDNNSSVLCSKAWSCITVGLTICRALLQPAAIQQNRNFWVHLKPSAQAKVLCLRAYYCQQLKWCLACSWQYFCIRAMAWKQSCAANTVSMLISFVIWDFASLLSINSWRNYVALSRVWDSSTKLYPAHRASYGRFQSSLYISVALQWLHVVLSVRHGLDRVVCLTSTEAALVPLCAFTLV